MKNSLYSITLEKLAHELHLDEIYVPCLAKDILITNREVNRPGLALAGFLTVFEPTRIQIIGRAEMQYLFEIGRELASERLDAFFAQRPVAVIITTNFEIGDEILTPAKKYGVPILRTKEKTSPTLASLIASLNTHLASRITQHGVLVEVFGEGVLILGESGIGKSETAIALVERGHRLIADDAVEIKRVSATTLVGTAPDLIRHYVCVFAAVNSDRLNFVAAAGAEAVKLGAHAGNILKEISVICDGRGGGRPDSAMSGGKNLAKVDEALAAVEAILLR